MITNKNCRFSKGGGNYLRLISATLILFSAFAVQAAASPHTDKTDATDLIPTLRLTFDEQSLANTGSGKLTFSGGTQVYVESDHGYALDVSKCAPYGTISGVFGANRDSAIAVLATLGVKSTGVILHFKNGNTSIMLRRGAVANQLILTESNSSAPLITVNDIEDGDTKYHLYVVNILQNRVDLYVDGELAGTTATTPRAVDLVNWQFGGRHGGVISGEVVCSGQIDDLRVYSSALNIMQLEALADSFGIGSKLAILPIPDYVNETFSSSRPEFVVSNKETSVTYTIGGDIANSLFDVEYKNNYGVGEATVMVVGKGEYDGEKLMAKFNIIASKMVDENIWSTDTSVRRLIVGDKYVYIFTNAEAEQVTVAKRSLIVKDVLLVGGGGAGGNSFGGGGGGGGVVAIDNVNAFFKSSDTIPFAVGKGGASGTGRNRGGNGGDSTFVIEGTTYIAKGGGGGGGFDQKAGSAGGSGGGGCNAAGGGAGTEGQGYSGANAGYGSRSGGGGGAGHAGYQYTDGSTNRAGNGGEGVLSTITGEEVYYGGGGGGGGSVYGWENYDSGFGGLGGGGDGVRGGNGQKGADGLGGGGGGSGWANNTYFIGGKGGSGTVILVVEPMGLDLLPIPDQSHDNGEPCRPEMVVSNTQNSATWTIGGDITSSLFDVKYENNDGIGIAKVTVVGKGDYAGKMLVGYFNIFATKFEDANISVADPSVRRRDIDGSHVYIFTNAASAKTVTVKRNISLTGFLLVGGGGGGGHTMAGGGGGGGVTNATGLVGVHAYKNDTFKLVIGAGGEGSTGQSAKGGNGRETTLDFGLFAVSAFGGGGGGSWKSASGAKGASGGGGCQSSSGGVAIDGMGFAGAAGSTYNGSGSGGGGGAGHAGYTANTTSKIAGYGGEGVSNNITGAWVVYGGGGGGGGSSNGYNLFSAGLGGLGGGGDGARSTFGANGVDGLGGGGGYSGSGGYSGGNGGSGIAVLVIKPADFEIDPIPEQKLVSGVCEPIPVVYSADGETLLVKDVDYTVSYADNAQTGIGTMTITGIGEYAGKSATFSFLIYEVFFAKPEVTSGGDGKSWATAMSVSDALAAAAAQSGYSEVWISSGTISAPAIAIVNNANLTIRGGFAGTETTLAERQLGALTVFDGKVGNTRTSSILLSVENAAGADLVIERIKFCNAKSNGFVKKGGGSLTVLDCVIEANGRDVGTVYGRGMNAQSDGFGTLVVSNCVFAGNRCVAGDTQYGGFGLYAKSFKTALVDDSLFVTNGYDLTVQPGKNYAGYLYARGSAILADGTPIYVRRSRFSGNCCPLRNGTDDNWCGGTIALHGACGGSVIENCALIGNTEYMSAGANGPSGGAIAVRMGGVADKLTVRNCTIAYNLTQASTAAGGITVARGSVAIENTILWNNRRYHITTLGYGKDVHVASGSSAAIRNSFVTSLDATDEALVGVTVDGDSVSALDPKLVTSTDDFGSLLTYGTSSLYYTYTNPTIYEDLATMDAHLLSSSGYCVNGGAAGPATTFYSPAIDGGDPAADFSLEPAPNGGRINLGAYGNTPEASRTGTGTPSAEIDVTFPDNLTRPNVKIAMDSAIAGGYVAQVRLVCSSGGVVLSEAIYDFVTAGDILNYSTLPVYLQPGDSFSVAVTITVPGADSIEYSSTKTVTGELPPFYGKGGGANVIHVREGANCRMDGTSWTDAYPDLATALASVPDASKTEMWLAVSNDHMVASMTLVGSLTIRGGFTGVENTPQERPEGACTWLDGFNCNFPLLEFSVPSGALLTVERIRFSHAKASGIRKTGAGDLLVRDSYFTDRKQSEYNLRGGGIYASGGTVSITNCQFVNLIDYSVNALSGTDFGGDGIYLSSCAQAYIDDCLFATNGISFNRNKGAQARHTGSAAYINATPTVFRNCRFASNGAAIMDADGSAGTIHFKGASGGSKLINCALVGNSDLEGSQSAGDPVSGGTIVCNMSTSDATLDIENCTIAYNLTQGKWTGAGINVNKGTVNVKNSIVYGNVRNRNSDTVNAGADIEVKANGTMNISYTLVTGLTSNYIHAVEGGTLNVGIGVFAADPLFVTTMDDFQSLFSTKDSPSLPYLPQSARAACAALNVYPRTFTGYFKDGVRVRDPERVESPTIDAGDPKSDYSREPVVQGVGYHGRRVNLGAYGNTSEAALTKIPGFHIILR